MEDNLENNDSQAEETAAEETVVDLHAVVEPTAQESADVSQNPSQEIGSSPAAGESVDAWKDALSSRSTAVPEKTIIPTAQAHANKPTVTRRTFVKGTFWTGLGVTLLGFVGIFLDFFWPRGVEKF